MRYVVSAWNSNGLLTRTCLFDAVGSRTSAGDELAAVPASPPASLLMAQGRGQNASAAVVASRRTRSGRTRCPILGLLVPGTPASHGRWFASLIECNDNDEYDRGESTGLSAAYESWLAWQAWEAWGLNTMLTNSCEALHGQVRAYAAQLEMMDPSNYNAEQEIAKLVLQLINGGAGEYHLHVLTQEARRLMLAVAEAKRQRLLRYRCLRYFAPLVPVAKFVFYALLTAVFIFQIVRDFL
jgi:hypothetical protein